MNRILILVGAALTLVLAACGSSPPSEFYVLSPAQLVESDSVQHNGVQRDSVQSPSYKQALRIEVRRPQLPVYLQRASIVRRESGGKLLVSGHAVWGGDLAELVGATLTANLNQLLPQSTVSTETGGLSGPKDVLVELQIARFEMGPGGVVYLQAQVGLHLSCTPPSAGDAKSGAPRVDKQTSRSKDRPNEGWQAAQFSSQRNLAQETTAAQVATMSDLLGELSHFVAEKIVQRQWPVFCID